MVENTLRVPAPVPGGRPNPKESPSLLSREGVRWLLVLLAILAAGLGFGFLLIGQRFGFAGRAVFGITGACMFLWTCWGLWHWRDVVWVRRITWFYLATVVIGGLAAVLIAKSPKTADFLLGAWGMTLLFFGGLWLIRAVLAPPWPFLGIARTLIDEAIRMKIALIFIICTVVLVPYLPMLIDPKERLQYRIQFFLSWSVAGVSLLLSLMTIFLACGTICNEIRQRQIFLTMTKPVSRFQYLLGKWLGIVLLDLLLVSVAGVGIYAGVNILFQDPDRGPVDRYSVMTEVLVARQSVEADPPRELSDDNLFKEALERYRLGNHAQSKGPASPAEDATIRAMLKASWYSIGPHENPVYVFHGLQDAKQFKDYVQLRIKANTDPEPSDHKLLLGITLNGTPSRVGNDGRPQIERLTTKQYNIVEISPQLVDDKGDLSVGIINFLPSSINLDPGNGLEILYRVGRFEPNLIRTLLIVWIKLIFLAMLGLTTGTFLGFAVACLASMVVFIMATFSDYIVNALNEFAISKLAETGSAAHTANPTIAAFLAQVSHGNVVSALLLILNAADQVLLSLLSAFSGYSPIDLLVDGRVVSSEMVFSAAGWLVLGWTLACGLIGVAIFHRRELARVTV